LKKTKIMKVKPLFINNFIDKDTTNYSFLFGDFDNDNIKNADDKYPFDPTRSEYADEVPLTEELHKIRKHTMQWDNLTTNVSKRIGASRHRVKSETSCINKLRKKYIDEFTDIGAMLILVDKESDIPGEVRKIKRMYPHVIKEKNFYKNPKGGYYVAYHLVVLAGRKQLPVEIQIKTRRQSKFHDEITHTGYKRELFSANQNKQLHQRMMEIRKLDR